MMKSALFGLCIFSPGLLNKSMMKQSKHFNGITKCFLSALIKSKPLSLSAPIFKP